MFFFPSMKAFSLIFLSTQYALHILVIRYSKVRVNSHFSTSSVIVLSELLKTLIALSLAVRQYGAHNVLRTLKNDPLDTLKIGIPSFLYVVQNYLLYSAITELDAPTYQVTYQLKLITTALFSMLLLGRNQSPSRWMSLFILFVGISFVQASNLSATVPGRNSLIGFIYVFIASLTSGFSAVYFEKVLKSSSKSLWVRSAELSFFGSIIALISQIYSEPALLLSSGFFHDFDWLVWCLVILQTAGGILVAVVVKYADNVLKVS
ncbi:unnamed protein product [Protopolystoma xenopodis]|uniref:Uncharacterized protein n=1 Tax=Protopolystoma xenopodis TaxID=117903 RepID=A0A448X3W3_9PLAT|nr:unnamed protein product [Protopolystoma xenopodis]